MQKCCLAGNHDLNNAMKEILIAAVLKYGKGPWAKRAPSSLATDEWELLI